MALPVSARLRRMPLYLQIPHYTGVSRLIFFPMCFFTHYTVDMSILRGCLGYGGAAVSLLFSLSLYGN